jgi:hypothetical protein
MTSFASDIECIVKEVPVGMEKEHEGGLYRNGDLKVHWATGSDYAKTCTNTLSEIVLNQLLRTTAMELVYLKELKSYTVVFNFKENILKQNRLVINKPLIKKTII